MPAFVLLCLLLSAAPIKVLPSDESGKDKSFAAFKKELEAAVKRKDADFVRGILHRDVKAGFGASGGIQEFIELVPLKPDSVLWFTLSSVLGKGCARTSSKEFVCPLLFAKAPEQFDWYEYSVLTKDVPIRTAAESGAKVLTTRSYEVVKGTLRNDPWVKITTQDGVAGYVPGTALESPMGTRAFFEKGSSGWKLTFLGAGD